jgi:hypothetical protein
MRYCHGGKDSTLGLLHAITKSTTIPGFSTSRQKRETKSYVDRLYAYIISIRIVSGFPLYSYREFKLEG